MSRVLIKRKNKYSHIVQNTFYYTLAQCKFLEFIWYLIREKKTKPIKLSVWQMMKI